MFKKSYPFRRVRPVLSGAEGKAAALLTRGAYSQYVSTAKGRLLVCANRSGEARERRWRIFSTFPFRIFQCTVGKDMGHEHEPNNEKKGQPPNS